MTTTDAVLWVSHPAMMLERLGGMTILERQLFTLSRAGIRRVWLAAQKPRDAMVDRLRTPEGLQTFWVDMVGDSPNECRPPYLGMSGDHVVRVSALRGILSRPHAKHTSYQDETGSGVVQVILHRADGMIQYDKQPMPPDSCVRLQNPPDLGPALPWLLRGAIKSSDGLMAKYFDRHVSLAVTRRLLDTPLKPNHMTLLSTALGLAGTFLLARGTDRDFLAGALTIWAHTLLDGCDGELARLKFQESRFGGVLDFWGDNLVHASLFLCLAAGLARQHGSAAYFLPGVAAACAGLASALIVYRHSAERSSKNGGGPLFDGIADIAGAKPPLGRRLLARVEAMLAQRDFIYLLVACAWFGRLREFLWAAGLGAPLFLVVLLYLKRAGRQSS